MDFNVDFTKKSKPLNPSRPGVAYMRQWTTSVNRVSIGFDNGLSPIRRQAIIYTNAGLLAIAHLGTYFSEILIKIFFIQEDDLKYRSRNIGHFVQGEMSWLSHVHFCMIYSKCHIHFRLRKGWHVHHEGNYYFISNGRLNWLDASDACADQGGHLVEIGSAAEQTFLDEVIAQCKSETAWVRFLSHHNEVIECKHFLRYWTQPFFFLTKPPLRLR